MIKNILFGVIFFACAYTVTCQETFVERYRFEYNSTSFHGFALSDTSILVCGLAKDTVSPFKLSILFTEIDFTDHVKRVFYDPNNGNIPGFQLGYPAMFDSNSGFVYTSYAIETSIDSAINLFIFDISDSIEYKVLFFEAFDNIVNGPSSKDILIDNCLVLFSDAFFIDGSRKIIVTKLDSSKSLDWNNYYNGPTSESVWSGASSYNKEYIIAAGYRYDQESSQRGFQYQELIYFIDPNTGDIVDEYVSDTSENRWITDILPIDDGYIVASRLGIEIKVNPAFNRMWWRSMVYKMDEEFNEEWRIVFDINDSTEYSYIREIIEVEDDHYVGVGFQVDSVSRAVINGLLFKVSDDGVLDWVRYHHSLDSDRYDDELVDLEKTSDGGYVMCGTSRDISGGQGVAGWLIKVDSFGCLVPGCHLVSSSEVEPDNEPYIKLWPNPTDEWLHIYFSYVDELHISISDLQGRLIQNFIKDKGDRTYSMQVGEWNAGIYILTAKDRRGNVWSQQFVKY